MLDDFTFKSQIRAEYVLNVNFKINDAQNFLVIIF